MDRLVIIGLDCLAPRLVFGAWRSELPALSGLMERGVRAKLRSTIPPITVPAWMSMVTSRDPGELGIYGFRNRSGRDYASLAIASSRSVEAKTLWDHLSRARRRSLIMGVPLTYPPRPLRGTLVSCFLTPGKEVPFTHPPGLEEELDRAAGGEYVLDVGNFRTEEKDRLLEGIREMTTRRFRAFRTLHAGGDYDFAMVVEMGTDRIHHGFWRFFDPEHRLHEPGNPWETAVLDYYRLVDEEVGRTIESLPPDTSVMVVSDHGARAMEGAIALNEWLRREGYLVLREEPRGRAELRPDMVDWSRTRAWGEGGYYGRLFLNVRGREPEGTVSPDEYDALRDRLARELAAIPDEDGRAIGTVVYRPEEVYRDVRGIAPDLMVYFGDLAWRSAGTVGTGTIHLRENDTGPDDANHDRDGVFIWDRKDVRPAAESYSIYDIAPTVLDHFGIEVPPEMIGESLIARTSSPSRGGTT